MPAAVSLTVTMTSKEKGYESLAVTKYYQWTLHKVQKIFFSSTSNPARKMEEKNHFATNLN